MRRKRFKFSAHLVEPGGQVKICVIELPNSHRGQGGKCTAAGGMEGFPSHAAHWDLVEGARILRENPGLGHYETANGWTIQAFPTCEDGRPLCSE